MAVIELYPSLKHSGWQSYPKKLGLMRRRITPDAHKRAIPMTTFIIIFFPPAAFPLEIMMPPMTINTNPTIKIKLISILVKLPTNTGNALASLITVVFPLEEAVVQRSIQFQIKGTLVFNLIPQQVLAGSQIHLFLVVSHICFQVLHSASLVQPRIGAVVGWEVVQSVPASQTWGNWVQMQHLVGVKQP